MTVEKFDLSSIVQIDGGRIREAFEAALRRCRADCEDRPGVSASRTVTLKATLTPVCGESGEIESCDVQFQITDSQPVRKSAVYNMRARGGQLYFNELSLDDVRQSTLDETVPLRRLEV